MSRSLEPVQFYRRGSNRLETETVLGDGLMRWAYGSRIGHVLHPFLFSNGIVSRLIGAYCNSVLSRRRIGPTIQKLGIDVAEFADEPDQYPCFNAFFVRRLKPESRPFADDDAQFSAPADGRYLLTPHIDDDTVVPVKGRPYSIRALLGNAVADFCGGDVLVARLCPADYHRFHFPVSGSVRYVREFPGRYHSVNPIALARGLDVFAENKRVCTVFDTSMFGAVGFVEVGAFGVGSIVQTHGRATFNKMDEKGYFEFGGSTIILVIGAGRAAWSDDLVTNSASGYETLILAGDTIATSHMQSGASNLSNP